jgi:DNA-directed RNA polymerase subunit P
MSQRLTKLKFVKLIYSIQMTSSEVLGGVTYECMRCGTIVTVEELSRLPEIKCICGFRVFRKSRQPIVKQLKAI